MEKLGNRRFARYAWAVTAYNVAVILWGAYVRASGSGAGCGNHWPLCDGAVVPHAPDVKKLIEFTHRAMTGLDTPLVILLIWWAYRAFPRGHAARLGATLSGIFLVTEALIGAALVKLEHVASNPSASRGYSLSTHLVNTLTLLACLALTAWWGSGRPRGLFRGRAAWMAGISAGAFVLLGVTGAIAALGDTLFPAAGFARDFDPAANIFLRLRIAHPMMAALVGAWLVFYATWASAASRPLARALGVALGTQIALGVLNWLLHAPVWLQMVHLLAADTVWIVLVLLCSRTLSKGSPYAA